MSQFKITKLEFEDVFSIIPFIITDDRGGLLKIYSKYEFRENGVDFSPIEEAVINSNEGVIRGLHYQSNLKQSKLITCISGEVWVVIVGVDVSCSYYGKWMSYNLQPQSALFIPGRYAIGTLALKDSMLHIDYGDRYRPECQDGIRWDDPYLDIKWPLKIEPIVSERDGNLGFFNFDNNCQINSDYF